MHKGVSFHFVTKYQILHCVFAYPALSGFSVEVAEYYFIVQLLILNEHFSAKITQNPKAHLKISRISVD